MKKILIWLIIIVWLPRLYIQATDNVYVQYLDNRNGLPNNTVRKIFQDSKGFIWMSTLNGISCYDGYSFTNYFPESGNSISLADRRVKAIREDANGHLWFTTSADMVSCFDLKKNCFVDFTGCNEYKQNYGYYEIYPEAVWLWGRHNGLRLITYQDGKFSSQTFTTKNKQLKSDYVTFLKKDERGNVWIGTKKGLYRYLDGKLYCMNSSEGFSTIQLLPNKKIGFLTDNHKLILFDGHHLSTKANLSLIMQGDKTSSSIILKNKWILFTESSSISVDLSTFKVQRETGILDIAGAQSLLDSKGLYWIYNRSGKLVVVSPRNGVIKSFFTTSKLLAQFANNERYHVVYDTKGTAWIVSNISGLYSYNPQNGILQHYDESAGRFPLVTSNTVQSILIDRSGGFWIGSENTGVSHFRFVNDKASYFYTKNISNNNLNNNSIRLICGLSDGTIFLGTRNGDIYTYNASLTQLKKTESFSKNIYAICQDNKGTIWKASRGEGLFIGEKQYKHNEKDPYSLAFDQLFCLLKDNRGRMWIGTFGRGLDLAIPYQNVLFTSGYAYILLIYRYIILFLIDW